MELTPEFIQENGLTPDQSAAVNTFATTTMDANVADLKKEWDGKANTNAEAIIQGAGQKTVTLTGIVRNDGEKWADYLERSSGLFFEGTKASLERQKADLDKKIKEGGGDATIKQELSDTKEALDKLKQKEAQFADYEENDYKGKLVEANETLSTMQKRIAFNSVKPSFPETANKFEVKAKWADLQKSINEKYNVVLDADNEPVAVDKENEHKVFKLSELIEKDEEIKALSTGRQQKGPGAKPGELIKIAEVPFEVKEGATATERQESIKEYLASQNIAKTSPEYSRLFAELNTKILEKNPTKKK